VTKPFSIGELIARIRAIFRRTSRTPERVPEIVAIGKAQVNLTGQTVRRDDKDEQLSFYEVELLRLLHERAGQPVSRDEILSKIWGLETSSTNRTVDNFIVKLRRKIESQHDKPQHILTVYGYGYKLVI
jgi:DNA-binding response OmpR family regulator